MKRVIAIFLTIMMIASLTACGGKNDPGSQSAQTSESVQAQEPEATEPEVTESETTEPEAEVFELYMRDVEGTVTSAASWGLDLPEEFSEKVFNDEEMNYFVGDASEVMGWRGCSFRVPESYENAYDGDDLKTIADAKYNRLADAYPDKVEIHEITVCGLNGYEISYLVEVSSEYHANYYLEDPNDPENYYLAITSTNKGADVDRDKLYAFIEAFLENATFTYPE